MMLGGEVIRLFAKLVQFGGIVIIYKLYLWSRVARSSSSVIAWRKLVANSRHSFVK
jgi:hypothetical protein